MLKRSTPNLCALWTHRASTSTPYPVVSRLILTKCMLIFPCYNHNCCRIIYIYISCIQCRQRGCCSSSNKSCRNWVNEASASFGTAAPGRFQQLEANPEPFPGSFCSNTPSCWKKRPNEMHQERLTVFHNITEWNPKTRNLSQSTYSPGKSSMCILVILRSLHSDDSWYSKSPWCAFHYDPSKYQKWNQNKHRKFRRKERRNAPNRWVRQSTGNWRGYGSKYINQQHSLQYVLKCSEIYHSCHIAEQWFSTKAGGEGVLWSL